MKQLSIVLLGVSLFTPLTHAAQYSLDSWSTENVIASPFSSNTGSGLLSGEAVLTGAVNLSSETFLGIEYSAIWSLNLISSSITASNVSCSMSASAIAMQAPNTTCNLDGVGFFAEGTTTTMAMNIDALSNQLVLSWQTNDSLFSRYSFRLSEVAPVPVPASVWLFGSALLGLAGFKRKHNQ